jgi:hypothetical protein
MRDPATGDLVLVINAVFHPELIGCTGTVEHGRAPFSGHDRFGRTVSGEFVIVDIPGAVNRHGTTLWYFRPPHVLRIDPGARGTAADDRCHQPVGRRAANRPGYREAQSAARAVRAAWI